MWLPGRIQRSRGQNLQIMDTHNLCRTKIRTSAVHTIHSNLGAFIVTAVYKPWSRVRAYKK